MGGRGDVGAEFLHGRGGLETSDLGLLYVWPPDRAPVGEGRGLLPL